MAETFLTVKDLFAVRGRWTRDAFARNRFGSSVNELSPEAVCWCLTGAINRVYGTEEGRNRVYNKTRAALKEYPCTFNDRSTYEEVKALVERLDI